MSRRYGLIATIGGMLLRWRWPVMAMLGALVIIFEGIEHRPSMNHIDPDFVREVLLFGLFGPLLGGTTLEALLRVKAETVAIRTTASEVERQRLARQLHDVLGQDIAYLRLKLDQLTDDHTLQEVVAVRQELERMRDIASQAYEQVRGTLATLHPGSSTDLPRALLECAKSANGQGGFDIQLTCEGRPRPLPRRVQSEILYLFQEALTNAARHADATRVSIRLVWAEDSLTIQLLDNGRGFVPESLPVNGHHGLSIMQERAKEINGRLVLLSHPNVGTELTLWLPL
jgi:signal transduction histidine kinase